MTVNRREARLEFLGAMMRKGFDRGCDGTRVDRRRAGCHESVLAYHVRQCTRFK